VNLGQGTPDQPNPQNLTGWRIAVLALMGSVAFTLTLLLLALAGVSDPRPLGARVIDDTFQRTDGWIEPGKNAAKQANFARGVLSVGPQTRMLLTSLYTLHPPGSLIVSARQIDGDMTAGYGLWWGEHGSAQYAIGINSDGYLAVLKIEADRTTGLRPWELFPHVKGMNTINKFQADIGMGRVTIWLNDERVIEFEQTPAHTLMFGIYAETTGPTEARFRFEQISVWETNSGHLP